ncbi:CDP-alcohol phosphatidyltransferase family protein [Bradyrhizobium sp. DOA9]|uniref:CDP-alcohol phosphatidyltransferase family protein n=1 Tax=Bradyrhizobium sp. DOA9 TaxID=1126627 RepID=UPI0004696390|nr:CDP-alcohol phosphatidyltransferase family protein [Bradyrhizobium sp. DOA9]GAJ37803.1 phosphatidylserine synthase [Bradyrhizobium sp. DOA9]
MLGYLLDYANAITALGYIFATLGLFLALNGEIELGLAAMLWTWFLDHWDGHIARKTIDSRRSGMAEFGKSFDGFCDFIHGVVFPAIVLMIVAPATLLSLFASAAIIVAGAIRLSYFETFGLTAGAQFVGAPISWNTPLLALIVLFQPIFDNTFHIVIATALIVMSLLHVTTAVRVPAIRGAAVPIATVLAVLVSIALAVSAYISVARD